MNDDIQMEMIDARDSLGLVVFREGEDGNVVAEVKALRLDKLEAAKIFYRFAKQLKAMHDAEVAGPDREDGSRG